MNAERIAELLNEAAGFPEAGPVADVIPGMAAAVAAALVEPSEAEGKPERRVVEAKEKR